MHTVYNGEGGRVKKKNGPDGRIGWEESVRRGNSMKHRRNGEREAYQKDIIKNGT